MRRNRQASRQENRRSSTQTRETKAKRQARQRARDAKIASRKESRTHQEAKRDVEVSIAYDRARKAAGYPSLVIKDIAPHKDKRITKEIRAAITPADARISPFLVILQPICIIPDNITEPVVIADAGSVIRTMDQRVFYREWMSPITRRADETLVQYGNAKKLKMGWISGKLSRKIFKPVVGPTFLVNTKDDAALDAWDRLRFIIGNLRRTNAEWNIATFLANKGAEHKPLIREVIRQFGGTTVKNEDLAVRHQLLIKLVLNTEMDMASVKPVKKGKKVAKKGSRKMKTAKTKKAKVEVKVKSGEFTSRGKAHDQYVIKRLVQENPRRAGSEKAKIWARIKKGMTVGQFVEKGGTRAAVGRYIQNGWIKLLRPKGSGAAETSDE